MALRGGSRLNDEPHTLVTIGRFADAVRLSTRTLRLYDELGLLEPAFVDPATGYRYYRPEQATVAEHIRLLRSLEMPLEEIRALLEEPDPKRAAEGLERHRRRVESRVGEYQGVLAGLHELIAQPQEVPRMEILLKDVPAQPFLSVREHVPLPVPAEGWPWERASEEMKTYLAEVGVAAGPPFVLYHNREYDGRELDSEYCFPLERPVLAKGRMRAGELPARTVAYGFYKGPDPLVGSAYGDISRWVLGHGYEVVGQPYVTLNREIGLPVRKVQD